MIHPKQNPNKPYSIMIIAEQEMTLNTDESKREVLQPLTDIDVNEFFNELKALLSKYKFVPDKIGYTDAMTARLNKVKTSEYDK